jgi:hypothetical protein
MTDDIVARLRVLASEFPTVNRWMDNEWKNAADEIERLRLEMSIPRDEYAMTWKNLLDRIDGLDIVEWIRAYANAYSPSDYSSPIAREVVVRSDKRWVEAADEIERLRKERDEARRAVCCSALPSDYKEWKPEDVDAALRLISAQQGWYCFSSEATDDR